MSFNVGSFVQDTVKSAVTKTVDGIVNKITSGIVGEISGLASSLSQSLFDVGNSYDSISAVASLKVDTSISKNASDYFALAGKSPGRAAAADISALRHGGDDAKAFFTSINPDAKIAAATKAKEIMFISV
jgi:hypothetical protein